MEGVEKSLEKPSITSSAANIATSRKDDCNQRCDIQVTCVQSVSNVHERVRQYEVLQQASPECKQTCLQTERNVANQLRVQGFTIPTNSKNGLVPQTISSDCSLKQQSELVDKANDALIPEFDILLRECSRPESWYTSWRIAPKNCPQTSVSKPTYESLTREHAHLQQQMNTLSKQRGFDVKTNLELQEIIRQLQANLEQKDAVIQQLKAEVFSAKKIILQRNKLVEAYSVQWGQLMAESTKSVSTTDSLGEPASPPSHQNAESTSVARQQDIIRDLEAKVENGRIAEDRLKLLERQNTELKQQQQQLLERFELEKATLVKTLTDQQAENDKLRADLAVHDEEATVLRMQAKQFQDDYGNLQREAERSDKKHTSEAEKYRTQLAQLSHERDYYMSLSASSSSSSLSQESYFHPTSTTIMRNNASTLSMRTSPSSRGMAEQTSVQASSIHQPSRGSDPTFGKVSSGFSSAISYGSSPALNGFTCCYCRQSINDVQLFEWHWTRGCMD